MKQTGQILRENREKLGLTIHEISLALKINSRIIKAMEEGNAAQLPPRTFLRGFVQSYAMYLKLDMDHLMDVFLSEMEPEQPTLIESTINNPGGQERPTKPAWQKLFFWNGGSPKFTAVLIGIVALFIVTSIVLISRTIEKYQQESKVFAPPENVQSLEVKKNQPPEAEPVPVSTLPKSEPSPTATGTAPTGTPKTEVPKIVQVIKPELSPTKVEIKSEKKVELKQTSDDERNSEDDEVDTSKEESKKAELVKQEKAKSIVEKPGPLKPKPAKIETPKVEAPKIEAPKVEAPKVASASSQELILEAMDKVSIDVQIDGGAKQSFNMAADQIRTLKAKKTLKVDLNDGGAVSLIYNGKDIGVPGNLGKPMHLTYPK